MAIVRSQESLDYLNSPRHYAYYSLNNRNLDCILQNKIWLSHPATFNDPFDSMLRLSFPDTDKTLRDALAEYSYQDAVRRYGFSDVPIEDLKYYIAPEEPHSDPIFTDMLENVLIGGGISRVEQYFRIHRFLVGKKLNTPLMGMFFRIYRKLGIKCFSRSFYSPQMWSYYSSNHSGICVEYDFTNAKKGNSVLRDVSYEVVSPEVVRFQKDVESRELIRELTNQICRKSPDWKHEMETRLVSFSSTQELVDCPGRITAICFGYNANPIDTRLARSIIEATLPQVELYRSNRNRSDYCIDWTTLHDRHILNQRSKAELEGEKGLL